MYCLLWRGNKGTEANRYSTLAFLHMYFCHLRGDQDLVSQVCIALHECLPPPFLGRLVLFASRRSTTSLLSRGNSGRCWNRTSRGNWNSSCNGYRRRSDYNRWCGHRYGSRLLAARLLYLSVSHVLATASGDCIGIISEGDRGSRYLATDAVRIRANHAIGTSSLSRTGAGTRIVRQLVTKGTIL